MKYLSLFLLFSLMVLKASGADLFSEENFKPLVSDDRAMHVGDNVTIIIIEVSEAKTSNDTANGAGVGFSAGYSVTNDEDDAAFNGNLQSNREEVQGRSGTLRAQVSTTVQDIDTQGKLFVAGSQSIVVNGEEQIILIEGWLRPRDIDGNNVALSTRLSDVKIEYSGYDKEPGFFGRLFSWMGF